MLKSPKLLNKVLLDYLKSQLLINKRDGVIIHLDGTLMSLVNLCLAKQLEEPFKLKVVTCIFNRNKFYLTHLMKLIGKQDVPTSIKDLSKDLTTLSMYDNAKDSLETEIAVKKRLIDMTVNIDADKHNLLTMSNICYSQWCINFPHRNYQNLEHIHLLNRLYYNELQVFATHLGLEEEVVEREPSHYLYRGQLDKKSLDFTYDQLEDYLRNVKQSRNHVDVAISKLVQSDNRNRFCYHLFK